MPATIPISPSQLSIDEIVRRACGLYSLPAAAVEVLRLTNQPKVDIRALKECIEQDPALSAKLLRVVNSSLFGLSRQVGDLNQALALLGTKPLKLLVLGFSLPENLFLDAARDQLDWYWNSTLARAVAAREISEKLFHLPGDDAFLAGLLQDLGVLVLLGELGPAYAELLGEAIAAHADLSQLERVALGFDHVQLTAALLQHWNMPEILVRAIAEPHDHRQWAKNRAAHAPLVRVLHLAELLAQLVGQHRLSVLPDLMESGAAYCGMDKDRLHELVATLEPKVRQLASVLSLKISPSIDYSHVLVEAHKQLARVAESVVGPLNHINVGDDDDGWVDETSEREALARAARLREAVDRFLHRKSTARPTAGRTTDAALRGGSGLGRPATSKVWSVDGTTAIDDGTPFTGPARDEFTVRLTFAVGQCRAQRRPLSVVLVALEPTESLGSEQAGVLERLLDAACRSFEERGDAVERCAPRRRLLVLAGRDRQKAVAVARNLVERLREITRPLRDVGQMPVCTAAAGVAAVGTPAKNFEPHALVETADRCLAAALGSGGVKSLEVS